MTYKEFEQSIKRQGITAEQTPSEIRLFTAEGVEVATINKVVKNTIQTTEATSNMLFRDITRLANTEIPCR